MKDCYAGRKIIGAALLASFSRTVLGRAVPLPRLLERIREAFGLSGVAVLQRRDGQWTTDESVANPTAIAAGRRRRGGRPRYPLTDQTPRHVRPGRAVRAADAVLLAVP
jgi:hypothetical protein